MLALDVFATETAWVATEVCLVVVGQLHRSELGFALVDLQLSAVRREV